MIPTYLLLLELGKRRFYRRAAATPTLQRPRPRRARRIARRAARWSVRAFPGSVSNHVFQHSDRPLIIPSHAVVRGDANPGQSETLVTRS
jgi:hypothetical protein